MTTNQSLETLVENLESLRLPELQACFKQVVGKATRSPNRKFLMRTIREEFLMHKIREAAAARRGAAKNPVTRPTAPQLGTTIGIRSFRSCAGDEGDAFSCILCLNGQPAATVKYAGTGGEFLYDFTMSDGKRGGGPNDSLFCEYVASLPEEPWDPQNPESRMCKRNEDEVVARAIGAALRTPARTPKPAETRRVLALRMPSTRSTKSGAPKA